MGKESGSGSKIYDYFGDLMGVVCEGVVDELVQIVVDGQLVWPWASAWEVGETYAVDDLRRADGRVWRCILNHTSTGLSPKMPGTTSGATYWTQHTLERGAEDYVDITIEKRKGSVIRLYWGTQTQTVDADLQTAGNNYAEQHPDYTGICYVVLKDFWLGREKTSAPNLELVIRRTPQQSIITGDALNDGQANVMAAAAEALTSDNGLELASAAIDSTSFQATADALDAQSALCGASILLDQQVTIAQLFEDLAAMSDSFVRFNTTSKLIEAGYFVHGEEPASYTTLTAHDFTEPPKFTAGGWAEVMSRAVIQFTDRTRAFKQTSDKVDDLRIRTVLGEHRAMSLNRPYITRRAQALAHAAETLKSLGRPQVAGTLRVRREKGRDIYPGDWVLVDIDLEPGGSSLNQFFKVIERTMNVRGDIELAIEADESLAPIPWNSTDEPLTEVDDPVDEIVNERILETPAGLMNDSTYSVLALAERPSALITGYQVWFDENSGGDFQQLGAATVFAGRATLRTALNDSATTIEITVPAQVDSDRFSEQPGDLAAADDQLLAILVELDSGQIKEDASGYSWVEVCSISAQSLVSGSNYDLTVLRGRQGTPGRAFTTANCEVWLMPRSSLVNFTHRNFTTLRDNSAIGATPDSGFFRLVPFTYAAIRDLDECSNIEFEFPRSTQAGPRLSFTAPATAAVSVSGPYPAAVDVTGTASDPDGNLIGYRIKVQKSGGSEVTMNEYPLVPSLSASFDIPVEIGEPGTFFITVQAFDNLGLTSEAVFTVTAASAGKKVAAPQFFAAGGIRRIEHDSEMVFNSGLFELRCPTAGAEIQWRFSNASGDATGWYDYDPADPRTWAALPDPNNNYHPSSGSLFYNRVQARARLTGWSDSSIVRINATEYPTSFPPPPPADTRETVAAVARETVEGDSRILA